MALWLSQIYDYSIEISYLERAFLKKKKRFLRYWAHPYSLYCIFLYFCIAPGKRVTLPAELTFASVYIKWEKSRPICPSQEHSLILWLCRHYVLTDLFFLTFYSVQRKLEHPLRSFWQILIWTKNDSNVRRPTSGHVESVWMAHASI